MTDQEYTMRRDMLRDAIRKTQSELDGLKEELATLEDAHNPFFIPELKLSPDSFKSFNRECYVLLRQRGITECQYKTDPDMRLLLKKEVLDNHRRKNGQRKISGRLVSVMPDSQQVGHAVMRFEQ